MNIYFIHIPKTAGSSFRWAMRQSPKYYIEEDSNEVFNGSYNINYNYKRRKLLPQKWNKNAINVIAGHYKLAKYKGRKGKFITFLRHPVERVISHFYWYKWLYQDKYRNLPEKAWFNNRKWNIIEFACITPNLMTFHTDNDLEYFDFIGIQENFNESVNRFNKKFNLNLKVTGRRECAKLEKVVTNKQRKKIEEINMLDMELYEKALEMVKQ